LGISEPLCLSEGQFARVERKGGYAKNRLRQYVKGKGGRREGRRRRPIIW